MLQKTALSVLSAALIGLPASLSADALESIVEGLIKGSSSHYQEPSHYSNSGGYYPYTAAPPKADSASRNQHAFDVGYRVGQDDFHQHLSKHFTRHPSLYDSETHNSFARGYESGYDIAREKASGTNRPYAEPKPSPQHVESSLYPSGYYPYSPPPREADAQTKQRHAYDVAFRVGQDDFYGGHTKHFTRHKDLYEDDTHHNFALGYEHGYDKARAHATPAPAAAPSHSSGLSASVGQSKISIRDGGRALSTIHTAAPNIERYVFVNSGNQIVVKSRGNHGPATVELFDVRTGVLRDKVLAYAIKGGQPSWARGMED